MTVRTATTRDIPRLSALLLQVHRVHSKGRPDIFRSGSRKYTDEELSAILADPDTPVYVAVDDDDRVLGYSFCILRVTEGDRSLMDRRVLYIDDLCVDEALRGQQIGKTLYLHTVEAARALDCHAVELNVWCLNEAAMGFYRSCGLTPLKIGMEQRL